MNTLSDIYKQVAVFADANVPMKLVDVEAGKTYKISYVACGENGITLYITPVTRP